MIARFFKYIKKLFLHLNNNDDDDEYTYEIELKHDNRKIKRNSQNKRL